MIKEKYNSAEKLDAGSFGTRLFGYVLFYSFLVFGIFLFLMAADSFLDKFLGNGMLRSVLVVAFWLVLPFLFMVMWEKNIRKFRRKNGLSIYKDVREEMEQLEFNKTYAKEATAKEAFETSKESDKMNINYWFELLQKGAITQDEYEAKKQELL